MFKKKNYREEENNEGKHKEEESKEGKHKEEESKEGRNWEQERGNCVASVKTRCVKYLSKCN